MTPHTDTTHRRQQLEARLGCLCLLAGLGIFWLATAALLHLLITQL